MPGAFANLDLSPNPLEEARRRRGISYIDLTSSNPTDQGLLFPPEVLADAAADFWTRRRYAPDPHGSEAARAAIAQYYTGRTPPLTVELEQLFITASTSEAYSLLFALLTDPGDNILAPNVTYPLFDYFAELYRVELRSYQLDEQRGWQIDADSLHAAADERTRAVLLVSPHNPTGAVQRERLDALAHLGLPLICDEVFAPFTYGVETVPPLAGLYPDLPVFLLNGISKMFALPDLKLGWIVLNAPAQHLYGERLELLNDTFLGANSLTQYMLPTIFAEGMPFVATMVQQVQTNLTYARRAFADHPLLAVPEPDGGYYLFLGVRGWPDEEALALHLIERGVLVHPGYFYGDVPGTHILISALTSQVTFINGIVRLLHILT